VIFVVVTEFTFVTQRNLYIVINLGGQTYSGFYAKTILGLASYLIG